MKNILLLIVVLIITNYSPLWAQPACPDGERSLIVEIYTDQYPSETAWQVSDVNGNIYASVDFFTYSSYTLYQTQVCVPDSTCIDITLWDSFGDGIFSPGYFNFILEGDTLASGGNNFNDVFSLYFNCAPGQTCESSIAVTVGQHTALYDDSWYVFTPDSVGTYLISTCGLSDCDTKIWVYDNCQDITIAEDNQSTIFFNDDESDCAPQAVVEAFFDVGVPYYIRIGDNVDGCDGPIDWEIIYQGPIEGCTDPASCNYNPLATIDDGSCLPLGDPNCPDMPDLTIRQDILESSIYLTTINSSDPCLIEEGCLHGYGQRDIIRFTTHIANIGELDYYIGQPEFDNTQFTWDNCHNHFHYDGYAEYVLFTEEGQEIPIGFKNGFCVIDLGCTTGSAQYGCNNMGITAGCHDIYSSGLECQWIDVTDVPDGRYTFVTRVNWDFAPDKLGRIERDSLNNWAQVCIVLDRSSGNLEMSLDPDCEPYFDCAGELYGNTQIDCNGECGGTAIRGDLDESGTQDMLDAQAYVTHALGGNLTPNPCNDLNEDEAITVYDAALLASCVNYGSLHQHEGSGAHDHCNFPDGIFNYTDTVTFSIIDANFDEQYIDIGIYNPSTKINAYQFKIEGIVITTVENLVPETAYPIAPLGMNGQVIGISYQDSTIAKTSEVQPLCRVHYNALTSNLVCLTEVVEAINYNYEQTLTQITNPCVEFLPNSTLDVSERALACKLAPNPFTKEAVLSFNNPDQHTFQLDILTTNGQIIRSYENIRGEQVTIKSEQLPGGIYWYRLKGQDVLAVGKMVIE
jgi:hypothetical protein